MIGNDSEESVGGSSFGDLLDESESYDRPQRGDIRPAIILQITPDEIVVDLGVKRDGIVPKGDLDRLTPKFIEALNTGEEVPVYILNPNDREGNLLVSINLGLQGQDWVRAHQLLENGELVETVVSGYNRGGLLVRFGRLEGFVPASHALELDPGLPEPDRSEAMEALVGQSIGVKVIEVNQGRRRLILSQREAQREWRTQQKLRLLQELSVGDLIRGRVTGIRDFGVFVDLGGADGLIHVSELAWHRIPHPRDVVSVGDELEVYVLELDQDKQRIALSLRRVKDDPWDAVEQNYEVGQVIEGTVSNVVDFGAFVVLPDGIEGLLHVSEMANGVLTEPYSYVKRGDQVTVRIARIEVDRRRIGFTQQGLDLDRPTDIPGQDPASEETMVDPADVEDESLEDVDFDTFDEDAAQDPPEQDSASEETVDAPDDEAEEVELDEEVDDDSFEDEEVELDEEVDDDSFEDVALDEAEESEAQDPPEDE